LGLVGESGSGKSVTALSIAKLLPSPPARYVNGSITLQGRDVLPLKNKELGIIRGAVVSYIFQDPANSLNPVFRVGRQIREALRLHQPDAANDNEVIRLLRQVGIPAPEVRHRDYPHQLSGGMQQRVMIAMALASRPKLLIADEPTTALDATIQAQIVDLLRAVRAELGMSLLLISHNLGLVADLADTIAVMYAGQIVEQGPTQKILQQPLHPYTRALIEAVPRLQAGRERLQIIPGTVPAPGERICGCRFAPRCPIARAECRGLPPALVEVRPGRWVRCPYYEDVARS
jgi:peptide/nickel transport system ATP-binding protein/oligopeptide transport system ATP-binding protein